MAPVASTVMANRGVSGASPAARAMASVAINQARDTAWTAAVAMAAPSVMVRDSPPLHPNPRTSRVWTPHVCMKPLSQRVR